MSTEERFSRLLIVEDQPSLLRSMERALAPLAREVRCATTVAEAARQLADFAPEALILDVALPDGSAFDVLEALADHPGTPVVIAVSGTATPVDTFQLAQAGVRAFVQKPLTLEVVRAALLEAKERPPDVAPLLRAQVGHAPIHEIEDQVRSVLVDEALARSGGSKAGAARLLSISRQLLQHILRKEKERRDEGAPVED